MNEVYCKAIHTHSSGRVYIGSLLVGKGAWIGAGDIELPIVVHRIHKNAFAVASP